jgi:hypothetical protein
MDQLLDMGCEAGGAQALPGRVALPFVWELKGLFAGWAFSNHFFLPPWIELRVGLYEKNTALMY